MLPVMFTAGSPCSLYRLQRGVHAPCIVYCGESMLPVMFTAWSPCSLYRLQRGVHAPCIVYCGESMLPVMFTAGSPCSLYRLLRGVHAPFIVYCGESMLPVSLTAATNIQNSLYLHIVELHLPRMALCLVDKLFNNSSGGCMVNNPYPTRSF
jgi:hypothetical protein